MCGVLLFFSQKKKRHNCWEQMKQWCALNDLYFLSYFYIFCYISIPFFHRQLLCCSLLLPHSSFCTFFIGCLTPKSATGRLFRLLSGKGMLVYTCDWQAAEFQLMKFNFENSWAPHLGLKPRTFGTTNQHSSTGPLSCLSFIIVVIITCFLRCTFKETLICDVTSIHT